MSLPRKAGRLCQSELRDALLSHALRSQVVLEMAFSSFICVVECFKFSREGNLFKRRINVGSQGHSELSHQRTGT